MGHIQIRRWPSRLLRLGHRFLPVRDNRPQLAGMWCCLAIMATLVSEGQEGAESQELAFLRRQVAYLSASLACSRAEIDSLKARQDRSVFNRLGGADTDGGIQPAGLEEKEYRVLESNKELGVAVLNAGRRQGMRPGLEFAVLRSEKVVAMLKVIDVRSAIAGAVVLRRSGAYPAAQDRVILVPGSQE